MRHPLPSLAIAFTLSACALGKPSIRGAGKVGQPLVLLAQDMEGHPVDVAAERGKVRVIDFWATWCEPCRDELPVLDRLAQELSGRGLSIYAVSFDEDRSQIPAFLKEVPVGFPVLWDKGGEGNAERFGINRLPTALLVDRQGIIRYVHEGFDEGIARTERREIDILLAEPCPLNPRP